MHSSIILYELMCRFGLVSLPEESQQRVCVSREDQGRMRHTELLLMRLKRSLHLKEAQMCPGESISHQKPDLILEESKKKVLECL